MDNTNSPKSYASLSQQLSNIFDHMDEINLYFGNIETFIEQEYKNIENAINPENSRDISKELQYHMTDFLKSIIKNFENRNN